MKKSQLIKIIKEEVRNILSEQNYVSWQDLAKQAVNHRGFRRALRGSLKHKAPFVKTSGIIGMILTKYSVFNKVVGAVLNIVRDPEGPYAHSGRYMIDPETPVDPEFDQAYFNDVISDHFGQDGKYSREAQDQTAISAGTPFIKEEIRNILPEQETQVTDTNLSGTKPKYEIKGNMMIATITKDGKTYTGKAKIRSGNIGMAQVSATSRARQAMANQTASTPK